MAKKFLLSDLTETHELTVQIKDTLDVEELEKQLCQLHAKV